MSSRRQLTGPLEPALVGAVGTWLQSLGAEFSFSHQDQYRIELCFEELVTNITNYSDPKFAGARVDLQAEIRLHDAVFILSDPADPFDPLSRPAPVPADSLDNLQVGGQGIHLVREFSDTQRYDRCDGRNRLELLFRLEQPSVSNPASLPVRRDIDRRHLQDRVAASGATAEAGETERRLGDDRRAMGFISRAQIFHGVPYAALEPLMEDLALQDIVGEMLLLRRGEKNNAALVVLQGGLKVYLDQPFVGDFIAVGTGVCVGEMSIIDDRPISAFVVAEAGTRLLVIDSKTFLERLLAIPLVARNLMSSMAERMRQSDQMTIRRMRREIEMEQTQRELQYAHSIQDSLLPKEPLFPGDARLDCSGRMRAAREVGGDFYDIFALDSRYVFFVIADVCGKGLPAALFMVRAISALRAQSDSGEQPDDYAAQLITRLNNQLCAYNDAQQFLTAFCGILDTETARIRYINAGHNPPLLALGNGDFHYLREPVNPMVGMVEGLNYRAGEVDLLPGSLLLLYTDGATEAENAEGGMLGEECLLARMNATAERSASHMVDAVFDAIGAFVGDAPQSDDITVLTLHWPDV